MTGIYLPKRVRQFVRMVGAAPPHHPEPLPDEPFAPVYAHRPLSMSDHHDGLEVIRPPRYPDLAVFGPHGADPERVLPPDDGAFGWCARCDVHWLGDAACWNCGGPAA